MHHLLHLQRPVDRPESLLDRGREPEADADFGASQSPLHRLSASQLRRQLFRLPFAQKVSTGRQNDFLTHKIVLRVSK